VAYYPEQDPEAEWEQDARLMKEIGFDAIRIGEFAWSRMERADGTFTLDWLDRCATLFDRHGIKTILCTPTATPPAWLCEAHPDIHPELADGRKGLFGGRRHGSLFHPAFRERSVRIAAALAERFGRHPGVIGWQLDNEVGSYSALDCSPAALAAFHRWLEREYGSVDNLNRRWGLIFWNQEVERFDQVPAPVEMQCTRSPQHILAYNRFCHEGMADYLLAQAQAVRRHVPADRFLVASAIFPVLHHVLARQREQGVNWVDSVTVHHYPELMPEPGAASMHLDLMRSLDSALPFRTLEHQVGSGSSTAGGLEDRVRRCWSIETAAHGSRTLLWFHWRRFRTGCEWRHTPVVERDRVPREVFQGIRSVVLELKRIDPVLAVSRIAPDVQILSSYRNAMARDRSSEALFWMEIQLPDAYRYRFPLWKSETLRAAYSPLAALGLTPAFVREDEDWPVDQPLVATDLDICPQPLLEKLEAWCARGGTLICFPGAGERDEHGAHREAPPPGNLAGLFGAAHAHYFPMTANSGTTFNHMAGEALETTGANPDSPAARVRFGPASILFDVRHGEVLAPADAAVLGRYETGPYAGEPSVTERRIGSGRAVYLGAVPKTESDAAALYRLLLPAAPVRAWGCRRIRWTGPAGNHAFLINDTPAAAPLPEPVNDLLTGRVFRELPPYGIVFHPS
jgi:beta-galactosidase